MMGPVVQFQGTRWPAAVVRRLDFYRFVRDCRRTKSSWIEKVLEHAMGSSVLYHALREDPTILNQTHAPLTQTVRAG